MKNKTKIKIAKSLKRFHKQKKRSLGIRITLAWFCILAGLSVAGYACAYRIKSDNIIDNTVYVEAIQCSNGQYATDCSLIDKKSSGGTAKVEKQTLPIRLAEDNEAEVNTASSVSEIMKNCKSAPITLQQRKKNWERVKKIAEDNNFQWISYLKLLTDCEGQFNELSVNCINPGGGIDRGIFQINSYYHPEVSDECCYNLECATKWTIMRIETGHQHEWTCNKHIKNGFKLRFF